MFQKNRFIIVVAIVAIIVVGALIYVILLFPRYSTFSSFTSSQEGATEIQLEFTPFSDSTSVFVTLNKDGIARVVRYNQYQLVVKAVQEGGLSETSLKDILIMTKDPAFREALRRKDFSGEGLSRGDQFYLSLKVQSGTDEHIFGFVPDAPANVRAFIEKLLTLVRNLDNASLSDAYVRSRPIDKERFEELRREGKLRFVSVQDLPSDLQSVVSDAVSRIGNFHPLTKAQYERLLTLTSHGHDLFVLDNHSGHQLTLFKSAN